MKYISNNIGDTQKLAQKMAGIWLKKGKGEPIIIALEGELGAGKTTFTQAFSKALGIIEKVKSPTFVLMKKYSLKNKEPYFNLYHFDCYRIDDEKGLKDTGIKDIFKEKGSIILIEWAERISKILPTGRVVVHIDHIAEHKRNILITQK